MSRHERLIPDGISQIGLLTYIFEQFLIISICHGFSNSSTFPLTQAGAIVQAQAFKKYYDVLLILTKNVSRVGRPNTLLEVDKRNCPMPLWPLNLLMEVHIMKNCLACYENKAPILHTKSLTKTKVISRCLFFNCHVKCCEWRVVTSFIKISMEVPFEN